MKLGYLRAWLPGTVSAIPPKSTCRQFASAVPIDRGTLVLSSDGTACAASRPDLHSFKSKGLNLRVRALWISVNESSRDSFSQESLEEFAFF